MTSSKNTSGQDPDDWLPFVFIGLSGVILIVLVVVILIYVLKVKKRRGLRAGRRNPDTRNAPEGQHESIELQTLNPEETVLPEEDANPHIQDTELSGSSQIFSLQSQGAPVRVLSHPESTDGRRHKRRSRMASTEEHGPPSTFHMCTEDSMDWSRSQMLPSVDSGWDNTLTGAPCDWSEKI